MVARSIEDLSPSVKDVPACCICLDSARHHFKLVIGQILSLNLSSGDTIQQVRSSHGFEVSKWFVDGVLPPRLLQGHSPSGEPYCQVLVQVPGSSGELLVNGSEPPD